MDNMISEKNWDNCGGLNLIKLFYIHLDKLLLKLLEFGT